MSTEATPFEKFTAALDDLDAAVRFRKEVNLASNRGEDTTSTGAFRDAVDWINSASFQVSEARLAIASEEAVSSSSAEIFLREQIKDRDRIMGLVKAQIRNALSSLEDGDEQDAIDTLKGLVGEGSHW